MSGQPDDDWPVCWCTLSGPDYGHLWDRRHCPTEPVEKWHGTPGGYSNHKCRCDRCKEAKREYSRRYHNRYGRPKQKTRYVVRHKRKGGTGNRGKEWTSSELEHITARDQSGQYRRSALQAATDLGRTVLAVERARNKCLHEPRYIDLLGASA